MKRLSRQKTKEKAVETLLLTNYNQYYRLAYSYVHNENDAYDIVQNAAYKAIKNSGSLKQENFASTWLYRIVINEIFTYCRQQKTLSLEDAKETYAEDSYEDLDLKRALEHLPENDRMIVELKYFEDIYSLDYCKQHTFHHFLLLFQTVQYLHLKYHHFLVL